MTMFTRSSAVLAISTDSQSALVELLDEPNLIWSDLEVELAIYASKDAYSLHFDGGIVLLRRVGEDSRGASVWKIDRWPKVIRVDLL